MAILLADSIKEVLENAQYSNDRTQIPNNHQAIDSDRVRLTAIATALGIDFEATGFTFTAAKVTKQNGEQAIFAYSPYVGKVHSRGTDTVMLFWGNVKKPLSEVPVSPTVEETEAKRLVLEFDLDESCGEAVQISLMMPRATEEAPAPDRATLRKALKSGKLAEFLSASFEKPRKLSDLEVGTYSVIGYSTNVYQGEIKYTVEIEGEGLVKANSAIARKLAKSPTITKANPATLEVKESTEQINGWAIIPVDFITYEATQIPVYSF